MKPSQELTEFIVRKEVKKWLDNNKTFTQDLQNLIHEMVIFETKYGIKILYNFGKQSNSDKEKVIL